nr:MAG TPA: cold inducible protein [Caudoviricetes sp.]
MDEVRPINANHLRERIQAWIKEQESEHNRDIEDATTCYVLDDVLDYIDTEPTIDPKTLRPVAHWEDVPGSYKDHIGKDDSWFVPTTRCTNPECREINPCSLKTPFCPMCGCRMEDVPYDVD